MTQPPAVSLSWIAYRLWILNFLVQVQVYNGSPSLLFPSKQTNKNPSLYLSRRVVLAPPSFTIHFIANKKSRNPSPPPPPVQYVFHQYFPGRDRGTKCSGFLHYIIFTKSASQDSCYGFWSALRQEVGRRMLITRDQTNWPH